ncbi:MAG: gliding motility protein GldM [Bacteroidales bacterium]|jgi:gliding motility-associated protein GldM|nr:gliding motility protein GldM [Bacteroidales bacterium]
MAHGKETPRQKMIGMMYLVLTALLALNVSKDVLNAFALVDEGLSKTNVNFYEKNAVIYDQFERAAAENPVKAGPWLEKANQVKQLANDLYNKMQDLKIKIIQLGDGKDAPAIGKDGEIYTDKIQAKDNTDKPAQIMVGTNNNGEAKPLKAQIDNFRNILLGMVKDDAPNVRAAIEKALDTKDPPPKEGKTESWESEHFEHIPLIAVVTILSALQNNVRNAETEILRYLYNEIDAGAFKFNKLEAIVIPNSNYIVRGNNYEAKVFIAASDSTQDPTILVGSYKKVVREDGTIDYEMTGPSQQLPVDKGVGVYKVPGTTVGNKKWGGLIVLKSPSGGPDIKRPFESEYIVEEPSMTVSPTKMNVFYMGLDNPVEISVSGVAADKVTATINNGRIRKISGNQYIVNPERAGSAQIRVTADMGGNQKRDFGYKEFRVKMLPSPVPKVGGLRGGNIARSTLLAQSGVIAEMENFEFEAIVKVVSFKVSAKVGQFDMEATSNSNKFTQEQLNILERLGKGSKVYFEDIKASLPDGSTRDLGSITLKII